MCMVRGADILPFNMKVTLIISTRAIWTTWKMGAPMNTSLKLAPRTLIGVTQSIGSLDTMRRIGMARAVAMRQFLTGTTSIT